MKRNRQEAQAPANQGSLLRQPRLAQALDRPVPEFENPRVAVRVGFLSFHRLPRCERPGSGRKERKVALDRVMGLRLSTGPAERRDEHWMRLPKGRIDSRSPGGPIRFACSYCFSAKWAVVLLAYQ